MSIKETKRKGFNFFRSYFDVFNELPEEDKLPFITALLNKQFLGADPTDLKGMAKFAWISQQHSISEQVKGYEDKTGVKLPLSTPPPQGVKSPPSEQVEVKEKEEEKGKEKDISYIDFLKNNYSTVYEQMIMNLRIHDEKEFLEFFENKCVIEDIPFELNKIKARWNILSANWNKENKKPKKGGYVI